MKKLLTILLLIPFLAQAQSETHSFTTYDTVITTGGGADVWTVRIHRPTNMFTVGNADTASRPVIMEMQGQGEQGVSDTSTMNRYGIDHWLQSGWDGSVSLGNGTHYPILMNIVYHNNTFPMPSATYNLVVYLLAHYHIKPTSVYWTGYSQGAFTGGGLIEYETTLGDHAGMKLFKAMALFEGIPTCPACETIPRSQNCSTSICDTNYYVTWATTYHGREFYLEGSVDNARDGYHWTGAMNNAVPGSGYFSYEDAGGGGHCCWNQMYDPSVTNWTSVGTLGTYNSPSQAGTNTMGTYKNGTNVWQWMLQQGDSSLVGAGGPTPPTVSAGSNQTVHIPITSVTLAGSASAVSPATSITSYAWTQVSGPNTGTFSSTTVTNPTFSGMITGSYVLQLQATDNNSNTNTATVTITEAAHVPAVYHWPTTNANIVVSKSTYPTFYTGDSLYIGGFTGSGGSGYYSKNFDTLGFMNMPGDAYIVGTDSMHMRVDTSTATFVDNMDSVNHVEFVNIPENYNVNPFFTTYQAHAHSHFITIKNCTFRQSSGFSLTPPGSSPIPNFTGGANDTVNCFYHWTFDHDVWDTVGSAVFGGIQCLQLGDTLANQMWLRLRITGCRFNYLPNPTTGAGAISLKNCFMCEIDHDTVSNMGVVESPGSHAAQFGINESLVYIHDNYFGPNNFGNNIRSNGAGTIPAMASLFTSWDSHYNGVGRVYGNIDMRSRKYPFFQSNFGGPITTLSYYQGRRSPDVYNNTLYRLRTGATDSLGISHQSYNISVFDGLAIPGFTDTVTVKNNVMWGLTDTTAGVCTAITCQALITYSGAAPHYDTANNKFSIAAFSTMGVVDSIHFLPLTSGQLYHTGTTSPAYRTVDMNGTAVPSSAPSIGAMEPTGTTPPTVTPGSNQNITLPTSSATVSMTVTYNGGATGSAVAWTTVSIPSGAATPTRTPGGTLTAPTCAVSGMTTAGTYVFQCGATDSNSNTVFSNVSVIVHAGVTPPCSNCFPRFSKIISH